MLLLLHLLLLFLTSMSSTTSANTTLKTSTIRFTLRGLNENLPLSFLDRCTSTGCNPAGQEVAMQRALRLQHSAGCCYLSALCWCWRRHSGTRPCRAQLLTKQQAV